MSIKKPSRRTGKGYSRAEALDILAQCALLRESIDELARQAVKALDEPKLEVIDGGKDD